MPAQTRKDGGASVLRADLTEALIEIPFMNAQSDRRLLVDLVRRDVSGFPPVDDHPDARLHAVQIAIRCLEHPGGLRGLVAALDIMAPDAAGTQRVRRAIETASLRSLMPDSVVKQAHDILRRAAEAGLDASWPGVVSDLVPVDLRAHTPAGAFDHLVATDDGGDDLPPALLFIEVTARCTNREIAAEARDWVDSLAHRVNKTPQLRALRRGAQAESDSTAGPGQPAVGVPSVPELGEPGPHSEEPAPQDSPVSPNSPLSPEDTRILHRDEASDDSSLDHVRESDAPRDANPGELMPSLVTARPSDPLPQVWGDVPPRNPNFTGREDLLRQLHQRLREERETAVLPQALHGMGGVGKSQLAVEYVHRYSREYDLVWWISAEQEGLILTALANLAQRLKLGTSTEANSAVPAVREALSTGKTGYHNWLLVFDNAENLNEVRRYFPTGGAGKILVTSRNPNWERVARTLEVDVFTREESTEFLINQAPGLTETEADRLADALGDLPLAVEQAAAWRAATGMHVDEYLSLLDEKRIELLEATPSPDYDKTVAAAWDMSFDRLEQINPAALQLLQVCSFFAPEPILRDLFAGSPLAPITPELDDMLQDSIKLGRAIRDIQRYALAKFDHQTNTLQMHRLVQAVLVGLMDEDRRVLMRAGAHTLLANGNPGTPDAPDQWKRYQALRPHLMVSKAVASEDGRVRSLVFNMIKFLYHWGDHEGCEELAHPAYDSWRQSLGEDHPQTLLLAKYLGYIQWVNGKYPESRQLNERSLELYRTTVGDEDEGTLDAMLNVAMSLRAAGDFKGALTLDQAALETARRVIGQDDPETLRMAHNLAISLRLNGEFARARMLDEDTYKRRRAVLGRSNSETLRTLNSLIIDIRESGDYVGARAQQDDAYSQCVHVFGQNNPLTMQAARNLAVARRKAGDHEGARSLAEQTAEQFRRRYGDEYPETLAASLNYAVDLRHAGDLDAAARIGQQTLERYQKLFGERHPHTLSSRVNLAITLRLNDDLAGAYAHDTEVFRIFAQTLGPDHSVTLTCATNLASDLYAREDFQAAYELDIDTLERSRRMLGEDHPSTLACGANLALDLRALGRVQESEKIQSDTMTSFRRVLGDRHPATLNALQSVRADCDIDTIPL